MVSDAGEVTLLPERVRRKGVQFEKGRSHSSHQCGHTGWQ